MIVDVRGGRPDGDWAAARVLTWAEAGLGRGELPVPGMAVTLFDGINDMPGIIYAVHYGEETITVAPDHTIGDRHGW